MKRCPYLCEKFDRGERGLAGSEWVDDVQPENAKRSIFYYPNYPSPIVLQNRLALEATNINKSFSFLVLVENEVPNRILSMKLLVFIDACRGKKTPMKISQL